MYLTCVAVCCSVLQCAAVCCSVLQCVAVCCSVLQCVAVYTMGRRSWKILQRQVWSGVQKANNVVECQKVGFILRVSQCCSVLVRTHCNTAGLHDSFDNNTLVAAGLHHSFECCSVLVRRRSRVSLQRQVHYYVRKSDVFHVCRSVLQCVAVC